MSRAEPTTPMSPLTPDAPPSHQTKLIHSLDKPSHQGYTATGVFTVVSPRQHQCSLSRGSQSLPRSTAMVALVQVVLRCASRRPLHGCNSMDRT